MLTSLYLLVVISDDNKIQKPIHLYPDAQTCIEELISYNTDALNDVHAKCFKIVPTEVKYSIDIK